MKCKLRVLGSILAVVVNFVCANYFIKKLISLTHDSVVLTSSKRRSSILIYFGHPSSIGTPSVLVWVCYMLFFGCVGRPSRKGTSYFLIVSVAPLAMGQAIFFVVSAAPLAKGQAIF